MITADADADIAVEDLPVVGSRVTYHGSLEEFHGRTFLAAPCSWHCERKCLRAEGAPHRFGLYDPETGDGIDCVRSQSITPTVYAWPEDAVPMLIAEYVYMASYTTPGGSPMSRIVYYYTAEEGCGETWCHFSEVTPQIRRLDEQARTRRI
ncbi:hypothetical protein ACFWGI_37900 [Streptomyces niveus]|uniref:hypothetical protein n=1 Tax=Streptomyces niveus TaxID=193462 RepID=UPI00364B5BBE